MSDSHASDLETLAAQVAQRRTVADALRPVFDAHPDWRILRLSVDGEQHVTAQTVIAGAWTAVETPASLEGIADAVAAARQERWTPTDVDPEQVTAREQAALKAARDAL